MSPVGMSDSDLKIVATQLRKLTARVAALEKLLDRTLRQKPVSEKDLEKALKETQVESIAFLGKLIRRAGREVGKAMKSPI